MELRPFGVAIDDDDFARVDCSIERQLLVRIVSGRSNLDDRIRPRGADAVLTEAGFAAFPDKRQIRNSIVGPAFCVRRNADAGDEDSSLARFEQRGQVSNQRVDYPLVFETW